VQDTQVFPNLNKYLFTTKNNFTFAFMETNKKGAGAPYKPVKHRKKSMTCSITPDISNKSIKLFGSRGKAIELAVKHKDYILSYEKTAKKNTL